MISSKFIIWDIETLSNCSTWCFKEVSSGKKKEFVLFDDRNQFDELIKFIKQLRKHDYVLVGFNSINFDGQILEYIMHIQNTPSISTIITLIYNEAQRIISLSDDERFTNLIPEWKLHWKHIDLFKQKHYDGKAKMGTSLKWIQFSSRYHNIEEMPISHDQLITKDDVKTILSYNWNDVDSTEDFFKKIYFETELRQTLSDKYNLSLLNASEPRLAKEIFAKFLSEDMQIPKYQLKSLKTPRDLIDVRDIIFPYVTFDTPKLNKCLETLKTWQINPNSKQKLEYTFNYHNIDVVVALGGIHACVSPGIYEHTENQVIRDSDVRSYYPNLAIQNDLKPAHLGDSFGRLYNDIYQQRILIPKKDPINYIFKIILNSTYGLSQEKNSYLYDPLFTFTITVNGQLSLLMLAEKLSKVPTLEFLQFNTDGLSYRYDKQYDKEVERICKYWCEVTKLELEHAYYKKMIIVDTNNYIAVSEKGDIKKKGLFETELDYHKNPSFLIIPKALESHFVKGIDYREYITNNTDIYDFCAGTKTRRDFTLNWYYIDSSEQKKIKQQKVTRYFCSMTGGILMKDYNDGRQISIQSDQLVTIANTIEDKDYMSKVDYKFYFNETKKIIDKIQSPKRWSLL